MNQVQKKRLLNVVRALRESPDPRKFTMDMYMNSCGTPACAMGHYTVRKDLQRTFILHADNKLVTGKNDDLFGAMTSHFGITPRQVDELFGGYGCNDAATPNGAALYIERFVKRNEKENR